MSETTPEQAARRLVQHGRQLAAAGLTPAAAGNASVRVGSQVLLTATGACFDDLTEADLVLVDADGRPVGPHDPDGPQPSSEVSLHLEVYRRRPEVGAVVHTHGRHAVALSTVSTTVPALHYYAVELGGAIEVAAYRTYGTLELAEVTAQALGAGNGVLMAHHGGLTVGRDLATASRRAELLEWLCEVALLALAAGRPAELDARSLDAVRERRQPRPPS